MRANLEPLAVGVSAIGCSAVAEGLVAAVAANRSGVGALGAIAAFWAAASLVFLALFIPTLLVSCAARTQSLRKLASALREGAEGSGAAALIAVGAALGVGAGVGVTVGRRLLAVVSPRFVVVGTVGLTLVGLAIGLAVAYPLLASAARLLPRGARSPWAIPLVCVVAGAASGIGLWGSSFPLSWAAAPAGFFVGLAIVLLPPMERLRARMSGRKAATLWVLALGLPVFGIARLGSLAPDARAAVMHHAPYAANVIAFVFWASDTDGDGYSPLFFGGDCDDSNPSVYRGAPEVRENGIDESCSGADGRRVVLPKEPSRRPKFVARQNVVILMLDALRPDHLGFAGYKRKTSPNIDAFRKEAVYFEKAYTNAPSTRFAMAALFTGLDARRLPHDDLGRNRYRLREGAQTVARQLASAGYDTAGFTITYVLQHNLGLGQGFRVWRTPWPVGEWATRFPVMAEQTTEAVLEYLRKRPDQREDRGRYLLFAHYRCTHEPYIHYEEWDYGQRPIDRYDSALNYCDEQIGRVLDALRARQDWNRTTVVFVSDHGELFGEFGFTYHGHTIYEPDVRIALLARIAGIESGTVTTPVSILDVTPTLLELAGATRPAGLDGWSLLAHLGPDAPRPAAERPVFLFTDLYRGRIHHEAHGVLRWPHKYIHDIATNSQHLFNLVEDPGERHGLGERDPNLLGRMADMLAAHESFGAKD